MRFIQLTTLPFARPPPAHSDPAFFGCILNYPRDGSVPLPDTSHERRLLRQEAAFYCLDELVAQIDAAEQHHKTLEVRCWESRRRIW